MAFEAVEGADGGRGGGAGGGEGGDALGEPLGLPLGQPLGLSGVEDLYPPCHRRHTWRSKIRKYNWPLRIARDLEARARRSPQRKKGAGGGAAAAFGGGAQGGNGAMVDTVSAGCPNVAIIPTTPCDGDNLPLL